MLCAKSLSPARTCATARAMLDELSTIQMIYTGSASVFASATALAHEASGVTLGPVVAASLRDGGGPESWSGGSAVSGASASGCSPDSICVKPSEDLPLAHAATSSEVRKSVATRMGREC